MAANSSLLQTLCRLWRARGDASVTVDTGRARRTLHVARGELIGADSDVLVERLGVLLVADGKMDVALVEPIVEASKRSGVYFGDQLVAEGLISAPELALVLDRQALARFDRCLLGDGNVSLDAKRPVRLVMRRPLGEAIVDAFRSRLPLSVAQGMVQALPPNALRMAAVDFGPEDLALTGPELRAWRQLAAGQDVCSVLDRAQDPDATVRLFGGLIAVGALGVQIRDPIAEVLRTA